MTKKLCPWLHFWLRQLVGLLRPRGGHTVKLPEPSGWLANAILDCLRQWHRRRGRGVWVVTSGDIEQLAEWAADLQRSHRATRRWAFWQRYKVREYPSQISRNYRP